MDTVRILTVINKYGMPVSYVDPTDRIVEAAENGIGPFAHIHGWALRTVEVASTCSHCEVEPEADYGDDDCARQVTFDALHVKAPSNNVTCVARYDADLTEVGLFLDEVTFTNVVYGAEPIDV